VQSALGNLPELFIALFALHDGLVDVVKSALIGSVLANSLLVLGIAFVAGGLRNGVQQFHDERARLIATLSMLAAATLAIPTFAHDLHTRAAQHEEALSLICAGVLLVVFCLTLRGFLSEGGDEGLALLEPLAPPVGMAEGRRRQGAVPRGPQHSHHGGQQGDPGRQREAGRSRRHRSPGSADNTTGGPRRRSITISSQPSPSTSWARNDTAPSTTRQAGAERSWPGAAHPSKRKTSPVRGRSRATVSEGPQVQWPVASWSPGRPTAHAMPLARSTPSV
jgi:hypothetical protein